MKTKRVQQKLRNILVSSHLPSNLSTNSIFLKIIALGIVIFITRIKYVYFFLRIKK